MSGIKIIFPRGMIINNKPVFEWESPENISRFVVAMEDDSQNQIFKKSVTGKKLDYPDDAAPMEPGKIYFWTVMPEDSVMGMEKSGAAIKLPDSDNYKMLTEFKNEAESRIKANPSDTSPLVELMVVYLDFGLKYDAKKICSRLIKLKPDDENLKDLNKKLSE
jgi:hypothetical protein